MKINIKLIVCEKNIIQFLVESEIFFFHRDIYLNQSENCLILLIS